MSEEKKEEVTESTNPAQEEVKEATAPPAEEKKPDVEGAGEGGPTPEPSEAA